jgi:glycerol uptake facilitator-like aquaporin
LQSLASSQFRKQCFAEMLGTYLLVFLGPGSMVLSNLLGLTKIEALVFVAAVFGATVTGAILLLGRLSGANINPAVTVGSTLAGISKRGLFAPYVISQVAGGLLAGLTLKLAFGSLGSATSLGSTKLTASISPVEGVALEITGTFVLVVAALSAGSFVKSSLKQAILVGGTIFLLILLIGPLTGGSFNPARSLGPSLFSGYFDNQAVYYIGPLVGGACAGLIVRGARRSHDKGG